MASSGSSTTARNTAWPGSWRTPGCPGTTSSWRSMSPRSARTPATRWRETLSAAEGSAAPKWEVVLMGIAQKVAREFAEGVRARGQSYFAKGRVVVTSAKAGEIVVAKVRGTESYRVKLRLRGGR